MLLLVCGLTLTTVSLIVLAVTIRLAPKSHGRSGNSGIAGHASRLNLVIAGWLVAFILGLVILAAYFK